MKNVAVFIDRDGVINKKAKDGEYILKPEEFILLPNVKEAIQLLNENNLLSIIVSNQRCVGKGLISERELIRLDAYMKLKLLPSYFNDTFYCPDMDGYDRKPNPGMLETAIKEYNINKCYMIGDQETDIEAGKKVNAITFRIGRKNTKTAANYAVKSLYEAVQKILELEGESNE